MAFGNLPVIDMKMTGMNIERLRRMNHMKVSDVQEVFGFSSPQAIYKWERGKTLPALDNLVVLASIFHCSIDDIIVLEKRQPRG